MAGVNITRGPAAYNSAGTSGSTAGMNPNPNPFYLKESPPDREELKEGDAFLEELEFENEEEVVEVKEDPVKPQAVEAKKEVIRELTPHLIEEVSAAVGGGYQLTVFRKNKQVRLKNDISVHSWIERHTFVVEVELCRNMRFFGGGTGLEVLSSPGCIDEKGVTHLSGTIAHIVYPVTCTGR